MDSARYKGFFAGKRITFMGLGLLGRGIGDVAFLASLGAKLTVTDRKTKDELEGSLAQLAQYPNISYVLGEHRLEDFRDADMVIKAAGVPLDSPYIAEAQKSGVPVYMTTALCAKFAREEGATVAGVTGTRGKSTTTHLINHGLKMAVPRLDSGRERKIFLGGNVRGLSTLSLLPEIMPGDVLVLELDSWQLQGFGDLGLSPQVAVFTNLLQDHLNYYPSMDAYFADKALIYRHQHEGDHLFVGRQIAERVLQDHPPVAPVVPKPLPPTWHPKLIGEHNKENMALAAEALRALGLNEAQVQHAIETFEPVEGRLQPLGEKNGIQFYNDNNATTPDATVAALKSFPQETRIVLIAGGSDKGIPLEELAAEIQKHTKSVMLLPGKGTDRLATLLPGTTIYRSMEDAVKAAASAADPGDVVLLSPGFASFGLFKNEYDRNDQFVAAVQTL
jgi:UDP-N-acetylmuramoylalanine--D-glutamate ligase